LRIGEDIAAARRYEKALIPMLHNRAATLLRLFEGLLVEMALGDVANEGSKASGPFVGDRSNRGFDGEDVSVFVKGFDFDGAFKTQACPVAR